MNPRKIPEERLRAAFVARLDAAPDPSDAMLARTLAAIGAQPAPRASRWHSATRWWSALAAPARFATAAAIVIVGGTIGFGTVKTARERIIVETAPPAPVGLDRRPAHSPRLARSGSLQLAVHDIPSTAGRISELVQAERGEIVPQDTAGAPHTMHLLLRVRANRLDATMDAISALGTVDSRKVETADLAGALEENAQGLQRARTAGAAPARADALLIARLTAQRSLLEQRIATATVAVVLRAADPNRTAFTAEHHTAAEPLLATVRRTVIPLARGSWFATHGSELTGHRLRSFDLASSAGLTDRSRPGRTSAGRNTRSDRV